MFYLQRKRKTQWTSTYRSPLHAETLEHRYKVFAYPM